MGDTNQLSKKLKTRHIVMLSLGGAIGSGLFKGSGIAIDAAGPAVLISYLLGGLILFIVMSGAGKLVLEQKVSGGGLSGLVGPHLGQIWAHFADWVYWFLWFGAVVAEAIAAASFLQIFWPHVPAWVFVLIIAVATTAINMVSVRAFAETEYWLATMKVVVILLLIALGIWLIVTQVLNVGPAQTFANLHAEGGFAPKGIKGVLDSLLIVIYSYGGSELVALTVSEAENPKEAIPKAIRGVIGRIVAFYFIPMFIFLTTYSWKFLGDPNNTQSPFALIFDKIGIPNAAYIIDIVIILALFSAINSGVYATSRSLYFRVKDSQTRVGKSLAKLNKQGVPQRTILFSNLSLYIGVALSMIFGGNLFGYLTGSLSFTILAIWFILLAAYISLIFKKKEALWKQIVTIATLLVLVAILFGIIGQTPLGVIIFSAVLMLGILISYKFVKKTA